jgi:hypothetical protein
MEGAILSRRTQLELVGVEREGAGRRSAIR